MKSGSVARCRISSRDPWSSSASPASRGYPRQIRMDGAVAAPQGQRQKAPVALAETQLGQGVWPAAVERGRDRDLDHAHVLRLERRFRRFTVDFDLAQLEELDQRFRLPGDQQVVALANDLLGGHHASRVSPPRTIPATVRPTNSPRRLSLIDEPASGEPSGTWIQDS